MHDNFLAITVEFSFSIRLEIQNYGISESKISSMFLSLRFKGLFGNQ